jgi:hypothetical protein
MRTLSILASIVVVVLASSCASSGASDSGNPDLQFQLTPSNFNANVLYFPGPVSVTFQLTVRNPTNQPYTLRSLELRTTGGGPFRLRTGSVPVNKTIAPNGSTTVQIAAWGRSSGGYLAAEEPVTISGTAYLQDSNGKNFVRLFQQFVSAS